MGLSGSLEDMPLQDILQIIHHSKKSGTLYLSSPRGEGTIVFKEGAIVQSFSPGERIDIGKTLVETGRITLDVLKASVAAQNRDSHGRRLGSILIEQGAVRFEDIEDVVKKQIQLAVDHLLGWREGTFNLVLEDVPSYDTIAVALDELALPHGMDTQHLLLEALRTWDERGRGFRASHEAEPLQEMEDPGASLDAATESFPPDAYEDAMPPLTSPGRSEAPEAEAPEDAAAGEGSIPKRQALMTPLVMIVPDPELAARLFDRFREIGFPVETTASPADAMELLPLFCTGDLRPALLFDPVAASSQGLSPIAFVTGLKHKTPSVPIVVLARDVSADFTSSFYRAGVRNVLLKPRGGSDMEPFLTELTGLLASIIQERTAPPAPAPPPPAPRDEPSPEVTEFKKLIDEFKAQRETASMTLSLLRIVSRRFERAIFLYAREGSLIPLGAFGSAPDGRSIAGLVRDLSLRVAPGSLFDKALSAARSVASSVSAVDPEASLMARIGVPRTRQACALPLSTEGSAVAILYCDQGMTDGPLPDLSSFEPLLHQAARSFASVMEGVSEGGA